MVNAVNNTTGLSYNKRDLHVYYFSFKKSYTMNIQYVATWLNNSCIGYDMDVILIP